MIKTGKILFGAIIIIIIAIKIINKFSSNDNNNVLKRKGTKTVKIDKGAKYRKTYAGAYSAEIEGVKTSSKNAEIYALNENGGAKWLWIKNDSKKGSYTDQEARGTWDATKNSIIIKIKGKTEMIEEVYTRRNNKFYSDYSSKRYLKKVE